MNLKNLFKYGLMVIFFIENAIGMEFGQEDKRLVIGCRPWDPNVQGLSGKETAHFVDFLIEYTGAPDEIPSNFHHLDLNDAETFSSGKFSVFASENTGRFMEILIDWVTYQHVRRESAWADFARLLKKGGSLIFPVTSSKEGPGSRKTAKDLKKNKLINLFNPIAVITILKSDDIPEDTRFDLFRRPSLEPGWLDSCIRDFRPVIVVATKKSKTSEDIENVSTREDEEKMEEETPEVLRENLSTSVVSEEKYKEVKFPSLAKIKEDLLHGKSTIFSETVDGFDVRSILCYFNGFRPEAIEKGFDLKMIGVGSSQDHKGAYRLSGALKVVFGDDKPTILWLKSMDKQRNKYIIQGGTETRNQNYFAVSDPEKIKILIAKD